MQPGKIIYADEMIQTNQRYSWPTDLYSGFYQDGQRSIEEDKLQGREGKGRESQKTQHTRLQGELEKESRGSHKTKLAYPKTDVVGIHQDVGIT